MDADERFVALWTCVQAEIGAYLLIRTGSHQLADDLEQETALTAWRRFASYDDRRPFAAWVMGIAKNKLREHARRERTGLSPLPMSIDERLLLSQEEQGRLGMLHRCLQELDPTQRALLYRHHVDREPTARLAVSLGCTGNALRVRLHRIRTILRRCMDAQRGARS